MKIKYKCCFWTDIDNESLVEELEGFGFFLPKNSFECVEFYDDDSNFYEIKAILDKYEKSLDQRSIYKDSERLNSKYLEVIPTSHHGYPQPEDEYMELCYDLKDYCPKCGIGAKQIKPLRFRSEPKWGKRKLMQLNWIFDEFFTTPEFYDEFFKPLGIGYLETLLNKNGDVLQNVVQLDIPITDTTLEMNDYPFEVCFHCQRKKYLPISVGGIPHLTSKTSLPIFKTNEYFGSGASANRMIMVNNNLYKDLISNQVRGVIFDPQI